jgi:uncharacterized protein YbcC (UPF0753/DUF2309 family)
MATDSSKDRKTNNQILNSIMAKWLAAFMDEGLAEWKCQIKKTVL